MTSSTLKVVPCGHQSGQSRFDDASGGGLPWIAAWRNNLTALSQYRNLYFVAYRAGEVHVFEPGYPDQLIPGVPSLILDLPESRPGLVGYIDPTSPRNANFIVVRDLGEEEVLLLACDNGDILGFRTRAIERVIQERGPAGDPWKRCIVAPFFHENVGASAWGLDVHSKERIIAVSSNTHKIILFAFALERENGEESAQRKPSFEQQEDETLEFNNSASCPESARLSTHWKLPTGRNDYSQRDSTNLAWSLDSHDDNIPAIAFLNSEPTGGSEIYLASVDIGGRTILWDVWSKTECLFIQSNARGWSVACVDFLNSRVATSKHDTYGCNPLSQNNIKGVAYLDNSECLQNLPDNSHWHPAFRKFSKTQPGETPPAPDWSSLNEASTDDESLASSEEDASSVDPLDEHDPDEDMSPIASPPPNDHHEQCEQKELPCGVFLTTENNLQLMINGDSSRSESNVLCYDALKQKLPPGMYPLSRIERLNMMHQIPELGILLVASQIGRLGIVTTTYRPETGDYGFKLEKIVPFVSQEDEDLRPELPLLGFAVSPVQGHAPQGYSPSSDAPEQRNVRPQSDRKFRLLMYYYDHTILSYEISRPVDGDDLLMI